MLSLPLTMTTLGLLAGCWRASVGSTAPADPCSGAALDLDEAVERCVTADPEIPSPSPDVLALGLADASVPGGGHTELVVTMRNTSARAPLRLVFAPGCALDASLVTVFDAQRKDVTWETQDGFGLCGSGGRIAITLAPGGVITKRIPWDAHAKRLTCEGDRCETAGSPFAPGTYRIELRTPFHDQVGDDPHHTRARTVSATLTISR